MKIFSGSDIRNNQVHGLLLDNLTILSAIRCVQGYNIKGNRLFNPNLADQLGRGESEKVNHHLNDAFRLAVDLCSLAQFVEALVLSDRIFFDVEPTKDKNSAFYLMIKDMQSGLPKILDPFVFGIRIRDRERILLLHQAINRAENYSKSELFVDFLRLLFASKTDGGYIHITNGYFHTGYSDPVLFPSYELELQEQAVHRILTTFHDQERYKNNDYVQKMQESYGKTYRYILEIVDSISTLKRNVGSLLAHAVDPSLVGTDMDLELSSVDILKNVIAALFHDHLAQYYKLKYFPHILRSSFVGFGQILSTDRSVDFTRLYVNSVHAERLRQARTLNKYYQNNIFDLQIPFILAMILENAKTPDDIFPIAVEIRESRAARDFRKWNNELEEQLDSGKLTLTKLEHEISRVHSLLNSWNFKKRSYEKSVEIGLTLGPLTINIPLTSLHSRLKRNPRHLVFIQRISQVSNRTQKFSFLVRKVFGLGLAKFWDEYRKVIQIYDKPPKKWSAVEPPTHSEQWAKKHSEMMRARQDKYPDK